MKKINILLSVLSLMLLSFIGLAQQNDKPQINLKYGSQMVGKRTDEAMNKWRSNRFGQFIHWGLYAIPGGIWKGKTYNGAAEWLKDWAKVPNSDWDALQNEFNPTKLNAKEWAKMAKSMGVKYMIVTTKHHEGFCLWDSKFTEFDIANTPYKKDILKQLIEAYNAEGIDVGLYYSVLDWHHPDWRYSLKTEEDTVAFTRYLEFAKNQLAELANNYPTVKAFWFDGTWDESVKKNGKWTFEIEQMLKKIHPGVIVNSRLRADEFGSRHKDSNGLLMGDYEAGYEGRLPQPWETNVTKWDWEACMTIPENQWGYHKDWSVSHVKTTIEILELLSRTAALGGNFLLNFGPKANGLFRIEEAQIAKGIGDWMKINGEAIYATDYAGLDPQNWGYFTKKNGTNIVNLIVFNVPISRNLKVKLLPDTKIISIKFLEKHKKALKLVELGGQEYFITLPKDNYSEPFVIQIKLQKEPKKGSEKALT